MQCGFTGNPDLYGIGIRVGYYTQAVSVWLANFFVLSESKTLRGVNILFILAMFIGLAWLSHTPSQVYAIETFSLNQLLCATWYVGATEKSRFSKKYWKFSPMRLVIRNLSLIALLAYNIWFWWIGLDLMQKTPCGTYIFFLGEIELYGWFRSAQKVLSVVAMCFHAMLTIGHVAQLVQHWLTRHVRAPGYFSQLKRQLEKELNVVETQSTNSVTSLDKTAVIERHCEDGMAQEQDTIKEHGPDSEVPEAQTIKPQMIDSQTTNPTVPGNEPPNRRPLNQQQTPKSRVFDASTQTSLFDPILPTNDPPQQFIHPTPTLRKLSSASPHKPQSRLTVPPPSFLDLLAADTYLTTILAPSPNLLSKTYQLPHTSLKISFPSLPSLFRALKTTPTQTPRLPILAPLFLHVYTLRTHPLPTYPHLLHLALSSPYHLTINPQSLNTTIALRTTKLPLHNRKLYHLPAALTSLFVIIGLVLTTELNIRWNRIGGLLQWGTVGQLVPSVIGIGGLAKVLWAWGRGLGESVEVEEEDGVGEMVKECAGVYYLLKGKREKMEENLEV
ncbi:hypothetical protein MMC12_001067 [Toensbergia leucococca]|nr:hypothetical protein [Toensbergia leucococca]